ncbi:transcription elongation factor, mitochondrial-like isoform X2 [Biomphalaria glabrata]|uniref:Transcription elongation factor, mitochondrial-like isoform X2 n=1 Tax=Biomphalaria glabrata TaxID=6526 RepID=A0A9U8E9G7_BIOGL|nr:transcription elongation factor, mitochondrial-like isoform X2 [Biomphalaria glabrata]
MAFKSSVITFMCKICCRTKYNPYILRSFVTKKSFEEKSIEQVYKPEDEVKILNILNTFTEEQLRQEKHLIYPLVDQIVEYRSKIGPFTTLTDLKKVKGVGPHRFKEICEKFLSDTVQASQKKNTGTKARTEKPVESYFSPVIKPEILKTISSVTSVTVCLDAIYFTTMDRDLNVSNWSHVMLTGSDLQQQTAPKILEQALAVVEALPSSNFYLFETRFSRRFSLSHIDVFMFVAQLQMALVTLLNKEFKETLQHNVYYVSDVFTRKAFGLNVGGEQVSGRHILKLIEDNQYTDVVSVPPELWRNYYNMETSLYKERYCSCLLVALGFFQHFFSKSIYKNSSPPA